MKSDINHITTHKYSKIVSVITDSMRGSNEAVQGTVRAPDQTELIEFELAGR